MSLADRIERHTWDPVDRAMVKLNDAVVIDWDWMRGAIPLECFRSLDHGTWPEVGLAIPFRRVP